MGRQPAMTKIGPKSLSVLRVRGGNIKYRALYLDQGTFSWPSESISRKCRVMDVVYNASNNELVRTKTLVKNSIIQIDATPFKQWYESHYGITVNKGAAQAIVPVDMKETKSTHVVKKYSLRQKSRELEPKLLEQLLGGRLYACITSRPGQTGRCDGVIIEGKELEFYAKKMQKKKGKGAK